MQEEVIFFLNYFRVCRIGGWGGVYMRRAPWAGLTSLKV